MKDFYSNEPVQWFVEERDPFFSYNGMEVTHLAKDGCSKGELTVTENSLNPMGKLHGGCLTSLADTVAGWGVATVTNHACVTVNVTMQFLRAARAGCEKVYCTAKPQKVGRSLVTYDVVLDDDQGKRIASGVFTFFLLEEMA